MIFLVPYACILSAFWVQYYTVPVTIARRKVRMVQISHELLPPIPSLYLRLGGTYLEYLPYAMQVNTAARLLRVDYQEYLHPLTLSPPRHPGNGQCARASAVCISKMQRAMTDHGQQGS